MNFDEFKDQFTEDVEQALKDAGIDAKVSTNTVEKMNESYEAMTITPEGSNVGVNVNMEKFFEAYENGSDYDSVVAKAVDVVESGFANQPAIDVAALTDYSQMKDKLVMEVVSAEANAEMLDKVPHQNIEDMAVVYRFVLDSSDDGRATILVTNQLLDTMGVTPEQLHADAMENAPELKPAVIKGMSEVMAEMMGMSPEELAMMGMPTDPADEQMFVATVPDKVHGAGIIAYQDFMDQASDRIGGGECLGLRWQDLDFEKRVISINHSVVYYSQKDTKTSVMRVSLPKTEAGIRTIPMLDMVKDAFEMEREAQKETGENIQVLDGMSGFVFTNRFGNIPNPQTVNDTIRRIRNSYNAEEVLNAKKEKREKLLLPHFSCHHLRHTFATRLCETETNLKVIQAIMGHRNIETTMDIYAEATERKKQESFEILASKLDSIF